MNKTFRSLWSAAKQAWVAVAETVRACGKACTSTRQAARTAVLLGGLMAAAAQAQTAPPPTALPTGGQLSAGQASISQSGASMVIQQGSERAAINWQSFNVGSQAQVQFQQPSASSVTLNRVLSADPSQIFGRITANGQVILTNPQGVYFGRDARVDVGGLIATTNSISDADFMAGKSRFERQGSTGRVVNEGELKAALGGYIALLAPEVRNQGAIIAQMGTVALAAGEAVDLKFDSHNRLTGLRVEPSLIQALVDNRHAVQAPGGLIILSAQSLDRLVGGVVRNSGRIEAQGLQQQGGRIILSASRRVENTGTLSANASASSAAGEGGPAGKIEISAPEVLNTGNISATGVAQQAGGSVRIEAAQFTQTEAGRIDLSAPQKGGSLSIQVSGSVQLQGRVDVSATHDAPATSPVVEAGISPATTPVVEAGSSPATQGGYVEVQAQGDIELREAVLDASGGQGGTIHLRAASAAQPDKPHPVPDVPGQGRLALMGHSTLSTRGRRGQGGSTTLLGDHLSLNDTTQIDAAGATGGGTVRVGGDWQGTNGVYQASTLRMGREVLINASGLEQGQGGTVVLWSDIHRRDGLTAVHGTVLARGGVLGGKGGRVETSGHTVELEGVRINAGADRGQGGLWLIDPYNYTIDSTAAASIVGSASSGLNSGTSVEVSTSTSNTSYGGSTNSADLGDITVSANISKTLGGDATLTLRAARDIRINSGVQISSTSNKLNLVLIADDDNANNGAIYLDGSSSRVTLTTNGGHVWMGGNGWGTANGSTSWNGLSVGTGWAGSAGTTLIYEGVNLNNAGVTTAGGEVYLAGRSNRYQTAEDRYGVLIHNSSDINTAGGHLTVKGELQALSGTLAAYPVIYGIAVNSSTLQTSTGSINLTGGEAASDISAGSGGYGVHLYNSTVKTTGATGGSITITGTTGTHSHDNNERVGVSLRAYGPNAATVVSTVAGGISISGTSNNTSTNQSGVRLSTAKPLNDDVSNPSVQVVSRTGHITLQGDVPSATSTDNSGIQFNGSNWGKFWMGFDGTNSYSGNLTLSGRSVSDSNVASGYLNMGGSGALTIEPRGNSFVVGASTAATFTLGSAYTLGSSHSAITLGKSTNTSNIAINAALSAAGPISLYGGDINLSANLASSQTNAAILLKAAGSITQGSSTQVSSSGGSVTYWSDSDGSGAGAIQLNAGTSSNSTSISTSGGDIVLGGGSSNPLSGYALNPSSHGVNLNSHTNLNAGAGTVSLRGSSSVTGGAYGIGVRIFGASITGGNVSLTGVGSSNASSNGFNWGVSFEGGGAVTASGTLSITGNGGGGGSTGSNNYGVLISGSTASGTGSGAVTLTGTGGGKSAGGTDNDGIRIENGAAIRSASGSLTLVGTAGLNASSEGIAIQGSGTNTLGAASGQSGHITLRANSLTAGTGNTNQVLGTGTLTIEPLSASTSFDGGGFTTSGWTFGSTLSGLTLGKASNTATLTVAASYGASIAGPITLYGGDINLSANLASSQTNAAILLKASGNILQNGGYDVTSTGGHITYWADSDGNSAGLIQVNAGTSVNTTSIASGGGNIVMGGGASDPLVGYATGSASSYNGVSLDDWTSVNAGAGAVSLRGTSLTTATSFGIGVRMYGNASVSGGNVTLDGRGGPGSGAFTHNYGVTVDNGASVTASGTLGITGVGGGSGSTGGISPGVFIRNATISGTGSGALTLRGTGGGKSGSGTGNYGIRIENSATIKSAGGSLTLEGTAGFNASSEGIAIQGSGTNTLGAASGQSGHITLRANSLTAGTGSTNQVLGTGTLTIEPLSASTSFDSGGFSTSGWTLGTALTGLTLGKSGNTAALTVAASYGASIAGPITLHGGDITVGANLSSSMSGAAILLKAAGNITQNSSTQVSTNGGSVTYWSDSDGSAAGAIQLNAGTSSNSTSISTSGGDIVLGGGNADPLAGDAVSTGGQGLNLNSHTSLNAGTGAVSLRGRSSITGGAYGIGVRTFGASITGGNVSLTGVGASNASSNGFNWGVSLEGVTVSASGALSITGTGGGGGSTGATNHGVLISGSTASGTGSGAVTITGTGGGKSAGGTDNDGIRIESGATIKSASGSLTLTGTAGLNGSSEGIAIQGASTIGAATGQSGAITLRANSLTAATASTNQVLGTGTLTIEPLSGSTSFDSGGFSTSGWTLGTALTGLTLGKSGNTAPLTVAASYGASINGPINLFGGAVTLNAGLTSTNTSTGDVAITTTGLVGSGGVALATGRGLTLTQSGDSTYSGVISGTSASFTKQGAGALTLDANSSYSGATTLSSGTLVLSNNAPTTASTGFSGAGSLRIEPVGNDFSSAFTTSGWTWGTSLGGLTIGKATGFDGSSDVNLTVASAISIAGPITLYGAGLALNGALTAGSGNIGLNASGAVTQAAALTAAGLGLQGVGSFTLAHASNNVGTLSAGSSAARTGAVSYLDASGGLQLGTVATTGVWSTGDVFIRTASGNLTLAESVSTTSTSSTALRLAAGTSAASGGSGSSASGNLLVTGSPMVIAGSGATISLYSGSVAGSIGLTSLVGSGTGRFRYHTSIDAAGTVTAGYSTALGSNAVNALYREQPSVVGSVSSASMTYGDALPSFSLQAGATGLANGDSVSSFSIVSPLYSGANQLKAGSYAVQNSNLASLGYSLSGLSNGSLSVGGKSLSVTGLAVSDKVYNASADATLSASASLAGVLTNDSVGFSVSASFNNKNVESTKTLNLSYTLSGSDAGNYVLPNQTGVATAALVTPKTVSLSAGKVYDGTSDLTGRVTLATGVGSETLTYTAAVASDAHVATTGKYISALTLGNASDASGGLAANYQLPTLNAANAPVTITRATLSVTADAKSRVYGVDNPSFTQTITGYVNGENAGTAGVTGTASASSAATAQSAVGSYTIAAIIGSLSAANYSFVPVNGTLTVTARPDTGSADAGQGGQAQDAQAKAHGVLQVQQGRGLALPQAGVPAPLVGQETAAVAGAASPSPQAASGGGAGVSFELQLVNEPEEPPLLLAVNLPPGQALAGTDILLPLPPSVSALARQGARIQASRPDGSPLPGWLSFDPAQLRLALSAEPDQALPLKLTLTVGPRRMAVFVRVHPK